MKAKFSILYLLTDSKLAVARFVIPILLSMLGAGIAIYSFNGKELSDTIISLLITVGLGISLFLAMSYLLLNSHLIYSISAPATIKSIDFPIDCKLPFGIQQMTDIVFDCASTNKIKSCVLENEQFEIVRNGKKYIFDLNSIFQLEQSIPEKGIFLKDMQPNSNAVLVIKYIVYTLKNRHVDKIKGILCE